MAVTTGMVGRGFYDRNSATQWAASEVVLPWLDEAVAEMDLADPPGAVGIVDFGCSEGANSSRVLARLVEGLRARTDRPIQTVQSDLPTNDFTALLRSLRRNDGSVFGQDVYSAIVGGSMFDRLLPPRSVHLATSFNAIGFLGRRPLDRLPGYILANGPSAVRGVGEVTAAEREACAAVALADVEAFLRARADELVPGGKLLIEVFGAGEAGRTCDGIYDVLNDAVVEALGDGMIDQAGYDAYYQPVYFRSLEELVAPVAESGAALAGAFRLDRSATYEVPVPFVETFRENGDVATYARAYTDFHRAFTEAPLCMAFPDKDPAAFADDIYARAERLVRNNPERYPFRYVSVAALMTRRDAL